VVVWFWRTVGHKDLAEVRDLPQRNLALEVLRTLLNDEIAVRSRRNVVQGRSFAEMLERAIRAYQNRSLEAAEVISELVELAKEMREAHKRGEQLGLRAIAHDLVEMARRSVTIDWAMKESARAKMRVMVKRLLRKYRYPPDKQEQAVQTILEQTEILCRDWAA
jgi:type I restriction enzyme R subunit